MIDRASFQKLALFMLFPKFQLFQKIIAVAKLCEIRYTNYNMYVEVERMAEQAENKKPQTLSDAEMKFNRQINYFIMRYMWQVVCGRNPEDTIYMAFDMSRERYTRIINTGVVRYGKSELDHLSQTTGMKKEIFLGEIRFKCYYTVDKKQADKKEVIKEQKEITEEDWKALFAWREKRTGEKGKKSPQGAIYERLRKVKRSDAENWDFYQLCYFLKEREPAPSKVTKEQFRDIVHAITGLSFSVLDKCEVAQLQKVQKLLKEKSSLVSGIIVYKNAKAADKKEK